MTKSEKHRQQWREDELAARETDGVLELPIEVAICLAKRWKEEDSK